MSEPSDDRDPFEVVAESFLARFRAGERPSVEEFAALHPELADQICELLPALVMVEQDLSIDSESGLRSEQRLCFQSLGKERRLGDYRILREIGRGGMGVVYEAEQISLGRRVALKVLPRHAAGDQKSLERFRREAKAAARLHHTNIVPVFEVGHEGELAFYAMQLIQGQGLDQVIDELQQLSRGVRKSELHIPSGLAAVATDSGVRSATSIGPQKPDLVRVTESLLNGRLITDKPDLPTGDPSAAIGLAKTERIGPETITDVASATTIQDQSLALAPHDLPSSAVLPGGTQVSAIDSSGRRQPFFRSVAQIGRQAAQGLAYAHARGIVHRDIKPSNLLLDTDGVVWITDFGLAKTEDDGLTATGDILGTLRYMAPCRFRGEGDARADIYALGLTLYELMTLRPAFDSSNRLELVERIKEEDPPRPRTLDHHIPRDLETIVLKAIEKEPEQRYQTAEAMAEDLRRFLADEPIRARQVSTSERYWRWARRNPTIAVLSGVLIGVLLLATIGSLTAAQQFHTQAGTQKSLAIKEAVARRKADEANAGLRSKENELRRTVYSTRSNLAMAAWDTNNVSLMRGLLDIMRPPSGDPDLRGWEWRYLWQLGHEDRLTLRAPETRFTDVVFSPDGQSLAGLERNGRIHFWDCRSGQLRRTTEITTRDEKSDLSPESGVHSIAFSPDGRSLAGPGPDASLVLYAVDTGLPRFRFVGSPGAVLRLAWSPDGGTLLAALSAHIMRMWDGHDGHLIHENFGGHRAPVASVAFSPDGRMIASASFDHRIKLWNPDDPIQARAVLEGHSDEVRAVAFSPDGRRLASTGLDRTIRIWDAHSGAAISVIWGHTSSVKSLAFLPDNTKVVTGSDDETVRIWDSITGQEIRTFKGTDGVVAVAVSPDGRDIAAAGGLTVRVWDSESPPRPRTLQSASVLKYGGSVECLAFSADGRRLVSGHDDNALRVWELPSGRLLQLIKGHDHSIKCVAISPDGRTIASGGVEHTVRLWDAETGQPRFTFSGHTNELKGLVFTPDGQTLFSTGYDRTIQAWDPATGVVRYTLRGHSDSIHDLAISPDGRTLASASYDKTCILWDLPDRRPRATLRGHSGWINTVAFSPDGQTVATASVDRTVRLWDTADGSPQGVLEGHIGPVDGLVFSPDGRLASSGWDTTIRLWDTVSKQTVLLLKGHAGRVRCIKFSPDGRTLASASHDRTIKLWEAAPATALDAP
jgi:WD40 repeat protein/serine/threonine protein kinase